MLQNRNIGKNTGIKIYIHYLDESNINKADL